MFAFLPEYNWNNQIPTKEDKEISENMAKVFSEFAIQGKVPQLIEDDIELPAFNTDTSYENIPFLRVGDQLKLDDMKEEIDSYSKSTNG